MEIPGSNLNRGAGGDRPTTITCGKCGATLAVFPPGAKLGDVRVPKCVCAEQPAPIEPVVKGYQP